MDIHHSHLRKASLRALLGCAAVMATGTTVVSRDFLKQDDNEFWRDDDLELWQLFGTPAPTDYIVVNGDTLRFDFAASIRQKNLVESDYLDVASRLGVEVAAMKAIVDIETGTYRKGLNPDDTPVINFDLKVFRSLAARRKINLANYTKTHPLVFASPDIKRFGSQQAAQHARLKQAMDIDSVTAIEATFWGMFQIGGFNWRRCGTESPQEFVDKMSNTERDQLDLFAVFIADTGLDKHLRTKNWQAFARAYNGPSYAKRGYHTRMASAYRRHSVNKR